MTNNSRFLILPEPSVANLASKVLRLTMDRLPTDGQSSYGHPVLVVEIFVYVAQFCATAYSDSVWSELGQPDGWERHRHDYYVKHDQPKRLFCRQLFKKRPLQSPGRTSPASVGDGRTKGLATLHAYGEGNPLVPRGQKDIAKFARGLSQAQRRALGIRHNPRGKYPAPTQRPFAVCSNASMQRRWRKVILAIREQMHGPAPKIN